MRALAFLVLAGCAAQPLDDIGIACTQDPDCPSDMWCDLRRSDNVCRTLATSSPPRLVFDGFVQGQQVVPMITVKPATVSFGTMRFHNAGNIETYVVVTMTGPACLDATSLGRSDGDLVNSGQSLDVDFDVDPAAGCASPATVMITATASGRSFPFTAMISIAP
ncbi:MAG TPA: hypothetical protein VLT45_13335 [Kofleriaceae bacterium]|nr:hypothetical protein [Kofleriaceae bacterium]